MKTTRKIVALTLCLLMISLLSVPALAAPMFSPTLSENYDPFVIPYEVIDKLTLSRGSNWVHADCIVGSNMNLRIDVKIYRSGTLVKTGYATNYGKSCMYDTEYNFISGTSYKVEATYTAGTEKVTKTLSFKA